MDFQFTAIERTVTTAFMMNHDLANQPGRGTPQAIQSRDPAPWLHPIQPAETAQKTHQGSGKEEGKMSTWFKYYRSSTDHHLRSKPLIWIYWLYCLEQAAWKDHTVFWKGEEYTLQTGHFITTIERDKDKNGLSQSQIRNARTVLAKCKMIDIESSRQGTLVKVNNWNDFQERNGEQPQTIQHKTDTQPTQKRHTTDTKTATTVEGIERKNGS